MNPAHYIVYEVIDDIMIYVGSFLANSEDQAIERARNSSERLKNSTLACQGGNYYDTQKMDRA